MVEDYKKYYYGRTDMIMLNDEKVYGSLGINLKEVTTIVEGYGSVVLHNSLKKPFRKFELLGNSTQGENPSPDNPQEIKSAGRKSKNLFNIADLRVGQVQKDGTINEKQIYYRTVILDVPQDGKYRITFAENNDYNMLYFAEMYTNGVYSQPYVRVQAGNPNHYITLAKGKNILSFSTHAASGSIDFTTDHNIMIAAESETLDYEPYGYLLDVKVTGKNLIKTSPILPKRWSNNIDNHVIEYITLKPHTTYTLAMEEDTKYVNDLRVRIFSKNDMTRWLAEILGASENKKKFTTKDDVECVLCVYHLLDYKGDVKQLQLVEGDISTPYEPYTEQTLTLTSDRPLTKWDKLVEQGGEYGIMYNSKHMLLNGSEDWVKTSINNVFYLKSFKGLPNSYEIFCDKLKNFRGAVNAIELNCILANKTNLYICIDGITDIGTLKTWLSENNLEVYYNSKESQFAPLSESEQTQLRNLHSYNGTTHITVDSGEVPCGIKVEYVVGV